jgi:probable HAF family extracellular repeat protein
LGIAVGQVAGDVVGRQAALWNNDPSHSLVVLGNPLGRGSSAAYGVSDDGRAVGTAYAAAGSERAVLWLNDAVHTPVDLGTLAGDRRSVAYGVNNAGEVVGVSFGSSSVGRGFLYRNGTLTELTALLDAADAAWSINEPTGINNAGQIVANGTRDGVRRPVMLVPIAPGPIASVTLTASHTAPQLPGTSITFTAARTAGIEPIQYKWLVHDGTAWTVLQEWSTAASFTWTPTTANVTYYVAVAARSAGNTTDTFEQAAGMSFLIVSNVMTGVTLTADHTLPQMPGTDITFMAAATSGVGPIQFKWWLYDGAAWTVLQDWSVAASLTWTPATANGNYYLAVVARSAGNTTDTWEQASGMSFPIVSSIISGLTLTADLAAPRRPGAKITFTAAAGGAAPDFKWWLYDGTSWTLLQDWSAAASFTWRPATANANYYVAVVARSAGNTTDRFEQAAGMSFPIVSTR